MRLLNFAEKAHDPFLYCAGILSKFEEESCDGCFGVHPFDDRSPRALQAAYNRALKRAFDILFQL